MLGKFDLHRIMMYYCDGEYSITGDPPYRLNMVTMHKGKKPTAKQINDWAKHFETWSAKKKRFDELEAEDKDLDTQYRRAQRLGNTKLQASLKARSKAIHIELTALDFINDPLDDFEMRN